MELKISASLPVGQRTVDCTFLWDDFVIPQHVFCVTGNTDLDAVAKAMEKVALPSQLKQLQILDANYNPYRVNFSLKEAALPMNSLVLVYLPETAKTGQQTGEYIHQLNLKCQETKSVAIVLTHSPYALREVIRSRILVLDNRYNHPLKPRLRTLGSDIGAINTFVLNSEDNLGYTLDAYAKSKTPISPELEKELASEAYMGLRRELEQVE
jgi:hypothetical protein